MYMLVFFKALLYSPSSHFAAASHTALCRRRAAKLAAASTTAALYCSHCCNNYYLLYSLLYYYYNLLLSKKFLLLTAYMKSGASLGWVNGCNCTHRFKERSNCTHRISLKTGLHLSIEICNALIGILHPSIEIPNDAPVKRESLATTTPQHLPPPRPTVSPLPTPPPSSFRNFTSMEF